MDRLRCSTVPQTIFDHSFSDFCCSTGYVTGEGGNCKQNKRNNLNYYRPLDVVLNLRLDLGVGIQVLQLTFMKIIHLRLKPCYDFVSSGNFGI